MGARAEAPLRRALSLTALWTGLLAACATTPAGDGADDPAGETDAGEESPCAVPDCADPACADRFECTWPERVAVHSEVQFTGREISCRLGSFTVPVDIPDCVTRFSARLTALPGKEGCADCDRVYRGPLAYEEDTCSELLDQAPPGEGTWGFAFHSRTRRGLYLQDGDGAWEDGGEMEGAEGVFASTQTSALRQDPPDCDNGMQHLGDLVVSARFTDR